MFDLSKYKSFNDSFKEQNEQAAADTAANEEQKMKTVSTKVRLRSEVPLEETWDLTTIFSDEDAWERAFSSISAEIPSLYEYQNKLNSSSAVLSEYLKLAEKIGTQVYKIYVYAHLKADEDTADSDYNGMYLRGVQLMTKFEAAISWAEPEIAQISAETMVIYLSENADIADRRHYLENILRQAPHQLSAPEELLLAKAGEIFNQPAQTFNVLNNADLKFPNIKNEKGEEAELTHGRYGEFLESRDRRVRRDAFDNLYKVYEQFANTNASTLSGAVSVNNYNAEVRGFSSARAAALFENAISEDVYDNLVRTVNNNLHLLHRYVTLRKKALGLDELHSYDLYVSLIEGVNVRYSFSEAQEIIIQALAPLGREYVDIIRKAFAERWIDRADNKGKRSGAYSSGSYGTNPYILMNWQGTLNDLFTLVHELGHSVHSRYSRTTQPFVYSNYSIFLAEIASTTNENLLVEYLLENSDDEKLRETVVNQYLDGFKGTVFRQTQFAEFEHMIHTAAAAGQPLTNDFLTEKYGEMNKKYYGEDLAFDPQIALEWSRIPHFYYNYYVYQYATGFSAATFFARMIKEEGRDAVDRYLEFLKAGSSDYPLSVLKKAGVDMAEVKPIEDAFCVFEKYLDKMEELLLP